MATAANSNTRPMDTQRIDQLHRDMPLHGKVEAIYKSTTALRDAGRSIVNVLFTLPNKTDSEEAIAALYIRLFGCVDSLTRLNQYIDVQVACSVTRSMYELLIDLLDLMKEPQLVQRFIDFSFVEKFRAARVLVEAMDKAGEKNQHRTQRAFY